MPEIEPDALPSYDINIWGNLVTVIVVLAIIVVLIILLVRFLGKRSRFMSQSRSIQTMGAIGLGPNKSLQVIQVGDSVYLVGVGENISLVDKISDPNEVAVIHQAFQEENAEYPALTSLVSGFISRFRKAPQEAEELESSSFHEVFQSQLQRMPSRTRQMEELLKDEEEQSIDRSRDS
ncbi:flagellar protein [Paenibacillus anaericanus]|uniref:Flagellar protein n=1 Tax=Paenibacillus anaericanus TaxID=170367 RepID=A0A3S1DWQ0_9BACL|nr:flagellar biosynthetic protein FliO [Paenibacillus anaericanus]RUT46889.1 flagellar protein [Paenibacillus anaericanus]